MTLGNFPGNGQPQARSLLIIPVMTAMKFRKYMFYLGWRNTTAMVCHHKFPAFSLPQLADCHRLTCRGELYRIVQ